jgi:predicted enzyme related to lactoylglutathione lyase
MPEVSQYAPGTPSWVDLGTPDIDASVAFYGGLFGWDIPESENADQTGGYRQAMLDGKPVAGVMPLMQEGQQPAWTTYVSVADADEVTGKVKDGGGQVVAEPMDVMGLGRLALFTDPTGAFFGIWQPGSFPGAGIVNEPGALTWNELNTRDTDAARVFYTSVLGWDARDFDMGGSSTYVTWHRSGEERGIGGMMDITGRVPDEVPANWLVYFAVDDTDATVAKATELGASVAVPPMDIPDVGRFAVMTDPHGAAFAVIKSTNPNP